MIKTYKQLFLVLILLTNAGLCFAQKGKITGTVNTKDGEPLPYATVSLQNTNISTTTSNTGHFSIQAPASTFILTVSYSGYITITKTVVVSEGLTTNLDTLVLNANMSTLKEVVVSDILKNKFGKKETLTASRMPLGDMETPTVYNMINKDLLQELSVIDLNGAMAPIAGTVANDAVNGSGQSITMRGFTTPATFRNGLYVNPRTQTEIYNLDHIEVMKGPSGTLFGGSLNSYSGAMSTYGGVVNTVTKKPFESFKGEISYTAGSWGLNRFTADINTPLNANRTALARVNALFTTQNSFQDAGLSKAMGLSLALVFKATEKTTVSFDAELYNPTKTLAGYVRNSEILSNKSMAQFAPFHKRSFTSDDIATGRSTYYASAEIKHQFNNQWMSVTGYQHGESIEKESIFMVLSYVDDKHVSRQIRPFDVLRVTTDNIQQNFVGDFSIGRFRNRMVIGASYSSGNNLTQNALFKVGTRNSTFAPYDVVVLHADSAWQPVSLMKVQALQRASTISTTNRFNTLGAYISDVFNILPNLNVMASLRIDNYKYLNSTVSGVKKDDNFTQLQISPKLGIVYQPVIDKISLFANYVNGFTNLPPGFNDDGTIQRWKPEQANQFEGGIKLNLLDDKLSSTISYYNVQVKDLVRYIDDITQIQDGKLDSKGMEFELTTSPIRGLNIVAGYGYNDNKFKTYDEGVTGKQAQWTPKQTASLWISYKILDGTIKGLGFGGGFNYIDKVFMSTENSFFVPAYSIANFTAFFDQPKYRVGLKLNNAFDKTYWNFYGQPQKPRELMASFAFKF